MDTDIRWPQNFLASGYRTAYSIGAEWLIFEEQQRLDAGLPERIWFLLPAEEAARIDALLGAQAEGTVGE